MRTAICLVGAFVMGMIVVGSSTAADHSKEPLSTIRKKVEEKKAVLVDVREKSEWDKGHVEGAIFLPLSSLQKADAATLEKTLPKDKAIYTHCVVGKRSLSAAQILEKQGYKVQSLKPGYKELIEAGFPEAKK